MSSLGVPCSSSTVSGPGAQSSPAALLGARAAAGDCAPLSGYEVTPSQASSSTLVQTTGMGARPKETEMGLGSLDRVENERENARVRSEYRNFIQSARDDEPRRVQSRHAPEPRNEVVKPHRPLILPDHFDGSISWTDYLAHFEMCAEVNQWSDLDKARFLSVSLRGAAQQVMGDLNERDHKDYRALVEAIGRRFNPDRQTELYRVQLRGRKRKPDESLPELCQAIKRLACLAYPKATYELIDSLGRDYFLDAIGDSNLRLQVYQARPSTIDEAVCVAIEFEAFQKAESQRLGGRKPARVIASEQSNKNGGECSSIEDKLSEMTKTLSDFCTSQKNVNREQVKRNERMVHEMRLMNDRLTNLESPRSSGNNFRQNSRRPGDREVVCYNCGEKGHIAKACYAAKQTTKGPSPQSSGN